MESNASLATGRWAREGDRRVRLIALSASLILHIIALIVVVKTDAPVVFEPLPVTNYWTLAPVDEPPVVQLPDIAAPEIIQPGEMLFRAGPVRVVEQSDVVVPRAVELPFGLDIIPGIPGVATAPGADPLRGRLEYRAVPDRDEIWRPVERVELSADEFARQRLAARLDALNDSIALEAGAAAKATDWTKRTADGGRWGVTKDSIYIGDRAVKNIVQLQPPPGRRDEIAGRIRTFGEIQYQVNRIEGDNIIDDRIKAIRARMDAERAKRNATTSGGATPPTTGG
jgi:hypothetical protein